MGQEAIVFVLLGLVGLLALSSGEETEDAATDDGSETPDPIEEVPLADPVPSAPSNVLSGTSDADRLFGDPTNDGISGGDGDDLILTFGAEGNIEGGEGNDVIALTTGSGTLVGGAGADVFLVVGDEDADDATHAVIKDFDPSKDKLLLSPQQSFIGSDQVAVSSATVRLSITEIETEAGPSTKLEFVPRSGFEDATSGAGFVSVILEGVKSADITEGAAGIIGDGTTNQTDQAERLEAIGQATLSGQNFVLGSAANDSSIPSKTGMDAFYGLGGDDNLSSDGIIDRLDIYGGSGDDTISGDITGLGLGSYYGGADDDLLVAHGGETLFGGDGTDRFVVAAFDFDPLSQPNVDIRDFDLDTETLQISADYPLAFLDLPPGTQANTVTGTATVELADVTKNGVAGIQIATQYAPDGSSKVVAGPKVFVAGLSVDQVPDGTFEFKVGIVP